MGLKGLGERGLASLLDSPPREASTVTHLDVTRLSGDLAAAVNYVVAAAAGGGGSGAPLVVSDGAGGLAIDHQALADHVQQAVLAAAASAHPEQAAQPQQAAQAAHAVGEVSGSGGEAAGQLEPASPSAAAAEAASSPAAGEGSSSAACGATAAGGGAPPGPAAPAGRLGPAEVGLVEAKGSADIDGLRAMSRSNFSTVRSTACVFKGRWMYEVQLGSAGIMQVGGGRGGGGGGRGGGRGGGGLDAGRPAGRQQGLGKGRGGQCSAKHPCMLLLVPLALLLLRARPQALTCPPASHPATPVQLGWTTLSARFNSEEGVGDNQDRWEGWHGMRWRVWGSTAAGADRKMRRRCPRRRRHCHPGGLWQRMLSRGSDLAAAAAAQLCLRWAAQAALARVQQRLWGAGELPCCCFLAWQAGLVRCRAFCARPQGDQPGAAAVLCPPPPDRCKPS